MDCPKSLSNELNHLEFLTFQIEGWVEKNIKFKTSCSGFMKSY